MDAGIEQRFSLFGASAENQRVAPFEAHDGEAAPRPLDQHAADFVLGKGMRGTFLPDVKPFRSRGREVEQRFRRQVVIEDAIGLFERPPSLAGNQVRVAGAGAHKEDPA